MGGTHGGQTPTERGQLGTQRSLLTDGGGGPIGLAGGGANRHDFKMARETIDSLPVARPEPTADTPQGMCRDHGDADDEGRALWAECGCTAHIRARGEEAQALTPEAGYKARRWVVERTHRWMNRFRRVLIRWDKNVRHSLGVLPLACASIPDRQSGLLG